MRTTDVTNCNSNKLKQQETHTVRIVKGFHQTIKSFQLPVQHTMFDYLRCTSYIFYQTGWLATETDPDLPLATNAQKHHHSVLPICMRLILRRKGLINQSETFKSIP